MIKVREKMRVSNTWYALGASSNATVIIVEEDQTAQYYFTHNSGKTFDNMGTREGRKRPLLTVQWPAGGKSQYASVADVSFFGQSPAQRQCVELKRHLTTLGYLDAPQGKGHKSETSTVATVDRGPFAHGDIQGFQEWFAQNHNGTVHWSRNLGDSQNVVIELTCPGYGTYCGAGSNKNAAKICAVAAAAKDTGYVPV